MQAGSILLMTVHVCGLNISNYALLLKIVYLYMYMIEEMFYGQSSFQSF